LGNLVWKYAIWQPCFWTQEPTDWLQKSTAGSVTRLGDFSHFCLLFTMSSFFENYININNFRLLFSTVKVLCWFDQIMAWTTFWAIFSQTNLVTLTAGWSEENNNRKKLSWQFFISVNAPSPRYSICAKCRHKSRGNGALPGAEAKVKSACIIGAKHDQRPLLSAHLAPPQKNGNIFNFQIWRNNLQFSMYNIQFYQIHLHFLSTVQFSF
jgi:hypothetical protein